MSNEHDHISNADEIMKEYSYKLEAAMEAANLAWWELDLPSGTVVFNKRKAELLSFPPERFTHYQDFMALVHPDDVEGTMRAMREYLEGRCGKYECEYRIATSTGEYKWFRDLGEAVKRDPAGRPVKLTGIALDITERKRAETVMAVRLRLHRFAESHSLIELLRATLDEAEAVTGSTVGFYHFVEPDQVSLSLQTWSTNTVKSMCTAIGAGLHYSIDAAGVWVDCIRERRTVIHNDYASLPHRKGLPEGHAPVIRELVVPVMRGKLIVAVLGVGNKPSDYLNHDIETIETLADLAWDIVEAKRRQEVLQRSEMILRSSQHIAHVGGWELDMQNGTMFWTDETYLIHDIDSDPFSANVQEHIATSIECYAPEDRPVVMAAFERCAKEGKPYDLEFRFTSKKGRQLWIRTLAEPIIENGTVVRLVGIIMDITERKRAEASLQQANTYHRSLIEASIDAIVTIGVDGRITDVNKTTQVITGCSREELIGSDFSDYFTEPDKARAGYQQMFHDGIVRDYPLEVRHRDGHLTPVLYNASVYQDANGIAVGVVATARDITERKRAETLLRDMQRRESLGVLTAGIAHDYNNLLGIMMGNISLAQSHLPPAHPSMKNMEKALSAMDRAAELTQQMLAYSGKGRYKICAIDLNETVREHGSLYTVSLPKNVKLITHFSPAPVFISGDPGQIEQILMNLIINGGEAIGAGQGIVSITVAPTDLGDGDAAQYSHYTPTPLGAGSYAYLEVADNGTGMTAETAAKIFDPFFTTKFTGRGLGLSAVLGIIQGHKGGIRVDSQEGVGTTFRIVLPAIPPPAAQGTAV